MYKSLDIAIKTISKIKLERSKIRQFIALSSINWRWYVLSIYTTLTIAFLYARYSKKIYFNETIEVHFSNNHPKDSLIKKYLPYPQLEKLYFQDIQLADLIKRTILEHNLFIECYMSQPDKPSEFRVKPAELNLIYKIIPNRSSNQIINNRMIIRQFSSDSISITTSYFNNQTYLYNYDSNHKTKIEIPAGLTFKAKLGERIHNKYMDFVITKNAESIDNITFQIEFKDLVELEKTYLNSTQINTENGNPIIKVQNVHIPNARTYLRGLVKDYSIYKENHIKNLLKDQYNYFVKSNQNLQDSLKTHLQKFDDNHLLHEEIVKSIKNEYNTNLKSILHLEQLINHSLLFLKPIAEATYISYLTRSQIYALSFLLGILFPFLTIYSYHFGNILLARTVKDLSQLRKIIGKNKSFVLPQSKNKGLARFEEKYGRDLFFERFRDISTYLVVKKPKSKVFLFTSTHRREGKTISAINVAKSIASLGKKPSL